MRRNELRNLHLVVEQRGDALLRLAHDREDQGVRILRLDPRLTAVFFEHDALADHQLLELVGSPSPWVFAIDVANSVLVEKILSGDKDAVEQIFEQRCGRLLGDDFHRVLVERDDLLDRPGVLLLLALLVGVDAVDGVNHVFRRELLAVIVALQAALEMERPNVVVVLVDLPPLGQHADIFALGEIINSETAIDLAPDGIAHRNTVGEGIEARDRLGHANGDLALGLGTPDAKAEHRRTGNRCRHDRRYASRPRLHLDLPTTCS